MEDNNRTEGELLEEIKRLRERIGELEQAEGAQQGSRYVEGIIKSMSDALIVINPDTTIRSVNQSTLDLLGYEEDELIGKTIETVVEFEEEEGRIIFMETFMMDGLIDRDFISDYEMGYKSKDGETIPMSVSGSIIKGEDGEMAGIVTVARDITGRKRAERQIRDIINAAPDVIHVISPDMRITKKNSASEKLFPGIKIGAHCYEALHGRDEACPHCGVTKVFKDGKKETHESTITLPDGEKIIVHSTSAPIFDENGGVTAAVEVLHDITKLKEAEAAIKKYAGELEEANRMKDLFTDIIRHDLLNPVDVIKNLTEMLAEEEKYKDSEDLRVILSSARKTEEMIQNASRYAKLEDIAEMQLENVELGSVIGDVISSFKPFLREKNMTVDYNPEGEYPVNAITMIEDVFANLMSNAIKYTPEGTTVKVAIADSGDSWLITFADQGEGVPDKYKESLFGRFKRRKKEGVKGSGLGLAIAQRIVDLHNGRIWIEDNPGGGSIFCVSLPK